MVPLRQTIPLQKVKIIKKSIAGTIGVIVICGFISIFVCVFTFGEIEDLPSILQGIRKYVALFGFCSLLFFWFCNPIYEYLYFKRYFYDMDERNISFP